MNATLETLRQQQAETQAKIDAAERGERAKAEQDSKAKRKADNEGRLERAKASWAKGKVHIEVLPPEGNYSDMIYIHENGTAPTRMGFKNAERVIANAQTVLRAIKEFNG